MIRRLLLLLTAVLVFPSGAKASPPALSAPAAGDCDEGKLVRLFFDPGDCAGVRCCKPDPSNGVRPTLLCTESPGHVDWEVISSCSGNYTVEVLGDDFKAQRALPCDNTAELTGPVNRVVPELRCLLTETGDVVYGYGVVVCSNGKCCVIDPGIWVNRGAARSEAELEKVRAASVVCGDAASVLERSRRKPTKPKPSPPKGPVGKPSP